MTVNFIARIPFLSRRRRIFRCQNCGIHVIPYDHRTAAETRRDHEKACLP